MSNWLSVHRPDAEATNVAQPTSETGEPAMTATCLEIDPRAAGLQRVIEPLASYICAADHPRAALRSILRALCSEVEETNRTALAHFGALAAGR
jgi:hypothetical protein